MLDRSWKFGAAVLALALLGSCGGGGGDGTTTPEPEAAVSTGFEGDLDWFCTTCGGEGGSAGEGVGAGGDGDGGVGAGGDFGQFRNALVIVRFPDGRELGRARTDTVRGMVTIKPGAYQGPLILELQGGDGAQYYEEGLDTFVDFPAGRSIRVVVPYLDKNIGITPFTEAAYRKLVAEVGANATGAQILGANDSVREILNQQFPATLSVDDITRLPFIKSPSITEGSIGTDPRGRYGLVNGAFSKQAAMFNRSRERPTLDAVEQLAEDLRDGVLDGMNGNQPAVAADARTYDPNTLTGELSSALAQQSFRFGTDVAKGALPKVLNFGNTRYQGYLFDASLTNEGQAIDTVAGWVGDNSLGRTLGQAIPKLGGADARVFGVFANHGHGSVFFKTDAADSAAEIFAIGDNVNGELGTGNSTATSSAVKITLPGVLTHIAGGFAHTVARFADGAVYTWGDNSFGQLGSGDTTASKTPLRVTLPRGAIAVAATNTASYALLDDGSVYAWGASGGFGLLGDGDKNSARATPAPITTLSQVVQITARDNDVAVLRRDGSVWHWGSFPADENAYTAGDPTLPYAGGSPLPQQVTGLPAGVAVRKILTEQGLFAALLADGTVWQWGVYFDITAGTILRDLQASRVLSLPPIRDMMPGGFFGYGVRPFDRLTAMGVDYRGGLWKIRGRVAEEFDPANPALQRRPQGQAPRPDCASCHIFLNDWPLTPDAPTSTDVCVPPPLIHGGNGQPSLIHAETACEKCHNPNRQPPAALFPNGWLTCQKPTNLPARANPIAPPVITTACTIPVGHSFTPPGTVCASCHNSIIARPLQDLGCAQPRSSELPSINVQTTISTAVDDRSGSVTVPTGSTTGDATPRLSGTLSAALQAGQVLTVRRGAASIGTATVSGTTWTFTEPGGPDGAQTYTARVEAGSTFGATSNAYVITIDTSAPTQTTTIAFADDVVGAIASPGFTSDTTPSVTGTLSAAPAAGERVRVFRGGVAVGNVVPSGNGWTYTEATALAGGAYSYTARVVDAGGNLGPLSSAGSLTVVTNLPTVAITRAANDADGTIAAGAFTNDATPTLQGTISAGLSGSQLVRILRDGVAVGVATVNAPSWTYTEASPVPNGTRSYTVRAEEGTVLGSQSAAYAFTVDTVAPVQTVTVTGFDDEFAGVIGPGSTSSDSTPSVLGSVSAALAANETIRVFRDNVDIGAATMVTATTWRFDDSARTSGTYNYRGQVVDAAGNGGTLGTAQSIVINLTVRTASVTGAFNDGNVAIASGGFTTDTTPRLVGTLNASLSAGQVVTVLRNGAAMAGTASVTGTTWTFTDPGTGDGAKAYTARVDTGGTPGTAGTGFSFTIDTASPNQTVTISGTSNAMPSSTLALAIPPDNVISSGGRTNDPTPTIGLTLSASLGANESLRVTPVINGVTGTVRTLTGAGTSFSFTEDAGVMTITGPTIDPPSVNGGSSTDVPVQYRVRVVDAAGNLGPEAVFSYSFGYFDCSQARATQTAAPTVFNPHNDISPGSGINCSNCHTTSPANQAPGGTPAGTFVAVPMSTPTYWCRRL